MTFPLISIVMATYNGEKFLHEQMQSLFNQTYPNLEIIISDDCSEDKTWEILNDYKCHPHIKIYRNERNKGFIKNFESLALLATGEYIAFCDQDDIWLPQKMMELFCAIGDHSLAYSDSILIDEHGNNLHKSLSDFRPLQNIYDVSNFVFFNLVSGHTMLVQRAVLLAALPIPNIQYHDWYIAVQAAKQNGCIYLNKKLTFYRQHTATCTKTIRCKNYTSRSRSVRYNAFLSKLNWLEIMRNDCPAEHKDFFEQLYYLYKQNTQTIYNFKLFFFLLKNQNKLYSFTNKNWLSRLIDIRKQARGEKMPPDNSFGEVAYNMQLATQ